MLRIDKAILDTNNVICDNIAQLSTTDRGLLSQNILGHIRNFVEYSRLCKTMDRGISLMINIYSIIGFCMRICKKRLCRPAFCIQCDM